MKFSVCLGFLFYVWDIVVVLGNKLWYLVWCFKGSGEGCYYIVVLGCKLWIVLFLGDIFFLFIGNEYFISKRFGM